MKCRLGQLIRYGVVGLLSNAAGYLVYIAITAAGMEPKLAMTIVFAVAVVQTFIFNRRWTFGHKGASGVAFTRYCASYTLAYFLNLLALYVLVDRFGYPHQIIQGTMICALAAVLFLLQKYWIFSTNLSVSTSGEAER